VHIFPQNGVLAYMNQLQKTEYLEKLKEALKSKSGDKNLPCVYPYIKKSHDPTITLPPI